MERFDKESAKVFIKSLQQTGSALAEESKKLRAQSARLRAASGKLSEKLQKSIERARIRSGRKLQVRNKAIA